jgi:hypothetical protein
LRAPSPATTFSKPMRATNPRSNSKRQRKSIETFCRSSTNG